MARKTSIHAVRGYSDDTAICGKSGPFKFGESDTREAHVTCVKCRKAYRREVKPYGTCIECGREVWPGESNPCSSCMPGDPGRYAPEDDRADYRRGALLMSRGDTVHWENVPEDIDSTCSTSTYDRRLGPYLGNVVRGGWVVDKRGIYNRDDFARWVIDCPLVDVRLANGAANPCPIPDPLFACALAGSFGALAVAKIANPTWRGLDKVSVAEYVGYWRERGARIGRRIGDAIQWEDGAVSEIPPYSRRYLPEHPLDVGTY